MSANNKLSILVVNDDGVYATGIRVLADHLADIADVTVVAPLVERSTTGHALTLDHPLRLIEIKENRYGCSGYPADCVLMSLGHVFKDSKPDLVISGINRGGNLGQDIYCSGTVAAAREAALRGTPSISISLVTESFGKNGDYEHYESAAHVAGTLVKENIHKHISPFVVLNINVPNRSLNELDGNIYLANLGFKKYSDAITERKDSRGRPYFWIGGHWEEAESEPGSDCDTVVGGRVSFTPLNLFYDPTEDDSKWEKILSSIKF